MLNKVLIVVVKAYSRLPFKFHFVSSWILFVLLNYIFRYREKVIDSNLSNSFPNKPPKDRNKIKIDFYRNFSYFIVETLKLLTISEKQLSQRVSLSDYALEEIRTRFKNNENIIVLSGHVFNWEYCCLIPSMIDYKVIISYKILKNSFWEDVIKSMRQRFRGVAVDYKKTYSTILRFKKENQLTLTWICGDQMPSWEKNVLTKEHFLNQKTYFFNGINELARRTNSIVYFVDLQRTKGAMYSIDLKLITEKPLEHNEKFVTKKYSELLEQLIKRNPANWLWSHKRWKEVPEQRG